MDSAVTLETKKEKSSRWDDLKVLLKVSRPGFWLTSVWFYLLPVGGAPVFASWKFWLGCLYVTFPLGLLIYGWNDVADYETDQHNPRKDTFLFGAKATPEQLRLLPRRIALVQFPFFVLFYWLEGWRALPWAAALVFATAIYNWPRGGLKARPPFDFLNQAGYLLVFVLASWLGDVPQLPYSTFVFGALFAMHSYLFGQIMDLVPDRLADRRTSASRIGIVQAKWLLVSFLTSEALLVSGSRPTGRWLPCSRWPRFGLSPTPLFSGATLFTEPGRCACSFSVGMWSRSSACRMFGGVLP